MINLICRLKNYLPLSYYRPCESDLVRVPNSGHLLTKWMASQCIMPGWMIDWLIVGELKSEWGERGGSVVECRTPEREVGGSKPTAAMLCPWARHFTPRKYWWLCPDMTEKLLTGTLSLNTNKQKSEWQVVCQCQSKYPWIHLIVGAPIKGGLIQYRERKIQSHDFLFPVTNVNKDGADLGSENS